MKKMILYRFKILFPRREIFELMFVEGVIFLQAVLLLLIVYIDGYEAFAKDYKFTHVIIINYSILFLIYLSIMLIAMIYEMTIGYFFFNFVVKFDF